MEIPSRSAISDPEQRNPSMSILPSRPTRGDPAETVIPRIYDDPAYAEAVALLTAFQRRLAAIERDRMIITYELDFAGRQAEPASTTDSMLRARWAALVAEAAAEGSAPVAPAAAAKAPAPSAAIAAAQALLAGEPVPVAPDHRARMVQIDRDHTLIRAAIFEQAEIVDQIAAELTFQYAKQLQPAWNALQLEMYRAAQELSRSTARVRAFRSAITAAGIGSRSDILSMPNVRSPLILGNESQYDSEISGWRRILENMGILK